MREDARTFAMTYDADKVLKDYWAPRSKSSWTRTTTGTPRRVRRDVLAAGRP